MRWPFLWLGLAGAVALGSTAAVYELYGPGFRTIRVSSNNLRDIVVERPWGEPAGLALLVSDRGGLTAADTVLADALRARRFLTLKLDLETWRKGLGWGDVPCMRPIGDVEDLSKETQRALGSHRYLHPVLIGRGEGASLVTAILGQALPSTVAGAVALDPTSPLVTRVPTCEGLPAEAVPGGGFVYPRADALRTPLLVLSASELPSAPRTAGSGPFAPEILVETDAAKRATLALDAATGFAAKDDATGNIPVVDLRSVGPARAVAVFFSGDGGWRDIDKVIGENLAKQGVHVLGIDALRHFWTDKQPDAVARDITTLLDAADPGGHLPVIFLGFSFGANVFPFAWPDLPEPVRTRTRLIALLGPAATTAFSVTVRGFLGLDGEHQVLPAIAALPRGKLLCIYGSDETAPVCADPRLANTRTLRLDGGHHFDRDYAGIARRILDASDLPK